MKSILLKTSLIFVLLGSIVACNSNNSETSKEYTSAYVCPMHCEVSGSDSAGTCPVCGMDYIENTTNNN